VKRRDSGCESDVDAKAYLVNSYENLAPTVGHDIKHCPASKNQIDPGDEKYEAGACCTELG